ncbi:MAG: hypothetical protein QG635_2121 [Bacteroidota bacterium]|nr:hypothetical protein [Bacteroidota bacterium]
MSKRLYRSRKNKVIGGVAGGLAEYFDVDPVLVRAIFVIATFAWGLSIVAYIIFWIIVPVNENDPIIIDSKDSKIEPIEETETESRFSEIHDKRFHREHRSQGRRLIAGMILVIIGAALFLDNVFPCFDSAYLWPTLLILIGAYILYNSFKTKEAK